MGLDILKQCLSPETRRAIFLNDKLKGGHQLERYRNGMWRLATVVDEVDMMLNPDDYRIRLYSVKGEKVEKTMFDRVTKPELRVAEPAQSEDMANVSRLVSNLRGTLKSATKAPIRQ